MKPHAIAAAVIMGTFAAYGQIAERYPGDNGIETDPAVILADNFESYTDPSQLTAMRWSGVTLHDTRIATEPGNVFAGSRSLEFTLQISSNEQGNTRTKILARPRMWSLFGLTQSLTRGLTPTGTTAFGCRRTIRGRESAASGRDRFFPVHFPEQRLEIPGKRSRVFRSCIRIGRGNGAGLAIIGTRTGS